LLLRVKAVVGSSALNVDQITYTGGMTHMTSDVQRGIRRLERAMKVALIEMAIIVVLKSGWLPVPLLFKKDLGIPESSKVEGIDKFAQFMSSLSTPLLIALAAIAPLALIFGAGALMFGQRRAGMIIAGTVGALALAACATGLVN
jgi:hypothetical protein